MSQFDFTVLDGGQVEKMDNIFFDSIYNTSKATEARIELANYFDKHPENALKFRNSYWRWFVLLCWAGFYKLSSDELITVINRQIPVAILLDIDVLRKLLSYFRLNNSEDDVVSFFKRVKLAVFES
ncbi:MAG: hypothetical protein AAB467_01745, partial [Patescibacteria group bacterium]